MAFRSVVSASGWRKRSPALGLATCLIGIAGCPTGGGGGGGGTPVDPDPPDCTPTTPTPDRVDLEILFETGDPVPGLGGARFAVFGTPIIDSTGRIAFWASFEDASGNAGLFVWEDDTLTLVVSDDPTETGVVPGRDTDDYFGDVEIAIGGEGPPMAWGSDGRLIFVSPIAGEQASRGIFRWRASDGDILNIVDLETQGDQYDDAAENAFSGEFFQPGVSDSGVVPYVIQYTYITTNNDFVVGERALFTTNAQAFTRVADSNPEELVGVPDQGRSATWTSVGQFSTLNPAGAVLFQAQYAADANDGNAGVYVRVNGRTLRVLDNRQGSGFDGLPFGSTVNAGSDTFPAITIGAELRMAVETTLTTANTTRETVLYWNGVRFRELEGELNNTYGEALLTGMNDCGQVVFLADGQPHLHGAGTSVNLVEANSQFDRDAVTWLTTAGALNNQGRALLRYTRTINELDLPGLAYWTGDELVAVVDPQNGDLQTADAVTIVARVEQDRPGRSGALNDADAFAFRVTAVGPDDTLDTADDIQTLYYAEAQ
jgi:hypothetical protein